MATSQTVFSSQAVPWRQAANKSELHHQLGPRIIRSGGIIMAAPGSVTLFNAPFHAQTIDRIIGCKIRANGAGGPGTVTITDLISGFVWTMKAPTTLGNYDFNIEGLEDQAQIVFTSSIALTAAMNVQVSLFNFEVPPYVVGHS